MKIWQKKDGSGSHDMVEKFTVGRDKEFDIMLAEYDVIGSIAHVKMLQSVGLPRGSACDGWLSGSRSGEPAAAPERNALSADPIVEIQSLWLTGLSD